MSAKVIDFPNKPETFEDLLDQLTEASSLISCASVVVTNKLDGHCHVFTCNMDASGLAFHALCIQREAMVAGGLIIMDEGGE